MRNQSSSRRDGSVAKIRHIAINILLGFGVTVAPTASLELVALDGTRFALDTLLQKCRREADDALWPQIAYDHFAEITGHSPADAALADAELATELRVQVVPPPAAPEPASVHALTSDLDVVALVAELVLERGGCLEPLTRALLGVPGIGSLWSTAQANTAAEPIDRRTHITRDPIDIDVLEGESLFVASKIIDMPHLVANEIGEAPYGVMLAIPNRHTLAFHRLSEAARVLANAHTLIDFACHLATRSTTPVTRELFYWYDGQMQQLTRTTPEGGTELRIAGVFEQVLREMP